MVFITSIVEYTASPVERRCRPGSPGSRASDTILTVNVTVHPGSLAGTVKIPASKSHTIRALLIAALAEGESMVRGALASRDTEACMSVLRALGVEIEELSRPAGLDLRVHGTGGRLREPTGPLDCMNSGTTLYLALSVAALQRFPVKRRGPCFSRQMVEGLCRGTG